MQLPPKVTERAFSRLSEIGAGDQGQALRIAVEGGGCSGFQYDIRLDQPAEDDLVLEGLGQKVVVDSVSLPFLAGATIDFTEVCERVARACWPGRAASRRSASWARSWATSWTGRWGACNSCYCPRLD